MGRATRELRDNRCIGTVSDLLCQRQLRESGDRQTFSNFSLASASSCIIILPQSTLSSRRGTAPESAVWYPFIARLLEERSPPCLPLFPSFALASTVRTGRRRTKST